MTCAYFRATNSESRSVHIRLHLTTGLSILLCLQTCAVGVAADGLPDELQLILSHPIVDVDQVLTDVRRLTAARVAPMPEAASREAWEEYADATRRAVLDRVVFRGVPPEWRQAGLGVEMLDQIEGGPGYHIRKLRYEVIPGTWVPALLYLPDKVTGKRPVFLNVNGHDASGKAAEYKQARCIHMARNGVIALNTEWFGMGQLATAGFAHGRMNQLDLCGTSGLSLFYLALSRGLDLLLSLDQADPERVGVAGLSGGGWQTILISALDTRVSLCNPVAGYSSFRTRIDNFSDLGDSEQTPVDLGLTADYSQLTALLAPRAVLLTYNEKDDCCFAAAHALPPLIDAAGSIYRLYGTADRLRTHVNSDPGTHNFQIDNRQALYRMIRDHWFSGDDAAFPGIEAPTAAELKSASELDVAPASSSRDFQAVALGLAESLPRAEHRPADTAAVETWRSRETARLHNVVGLRRYSVTAEQLTQETHSETTVTLWRLKLGDDWTIPVTELSRNSPAKAALVIGDRGRSALSQEIAALLVSGHRVFAVDPLFIGELTIRERGYLWALMIATVGERPLGLQAGQVLSVADWIAGPRGMPELSLVTSGPNSSVIGLVAAALDRTRIPHVETHDPLTSLKQIIERGDTVEQSPALFCFGLLEATDVPLLRELAAP